MGRLTEKDESGKWQVKGISWEKLQVGQVVTKEVRQILYGCLCKLKDYEDTGMSPEQVEIAQYGLKDMAAQVCDDICRYRQELPGQEELDAACECCPVSACVGRIFDTGNMQ